MGIGALFGKIFGTEKALERGIDAIVRTGDSIVYTQQEKAEHRAKLLTEARAYMIEWLKNSQGQNIARRFLAVLIGTVWMAMFILSALLDTIAPWVTGTRLMMLESGAVREVPLSFLIRQSAEAIGGHASGLTGAMMLILTFYFAAPHLGEVLGPAMQRFGRVMRDDAKAPDRSSPEPAANGR